MKNLSDKYMDIIQEYDMDVEDALRDVLTLLERVAPGVLQNEIDNIEDYLREFE